MRSALDAAAPMVGLGLALGLFACLDHTKASLKATSAQEHNTDAANQPGSRRTLIEVLTWWRAPGEAEALQALIDEHRTTHFGARIFNDVADSGGAASEELEMRIPLGDIPDVILRPYGHDLREFLRRHPGGLETLDDFFKNLGLDAGSMSEVIPEAIVEASDHGHIYAVPVDLHRENVLFFNKRIFAERHLQPPSSIAELLELCRTLKAAGVVPIATSSQGWILRIMFSSIAAGVMGSKNYHDYFTGQSDLPQPSLRQAIVVFADLLKNYINPDADEEGFGWTNAVQAVMTGEAAMLFHGDWAKGYLVQTGAVPDVDFGMAGSPGATDLFLYGADLLSIPTGAANSQGAREFLATAVSRAGQAKFNRLKGSSPFRSDMSPGMLDPLGQAMLEDLKHARYRMVFPNRRAWDEAMASFARTRDAAALFKSFTDNPPRAADRDD
jgi:glucose/mannose transport system substrate-binding protein